MVNKLRILSLVSGLFLILLSGWAATRYAAGPTAFLPGVLLGIVILVLPTALAHGKLWQRRGHRYIRSRRSTTNEIGSTYVSTASDPDPEAALAEIVAAIRDGDAYEAVRREPFSEGDGLLVTHAGFHNSFVRVTEAGKLVVTGASKKTGELAAHIGDLRGLTLRNQSNNPFLQPIPVRGSSRVFLSLGLVAMLVVGTSGVFGAAYPLAAYNTAEKGVFVSYDAREDFDPGTSAAEVRLAKASFMVDAISEEAVEISWERNNSQYVRQNGEQALAMSQDVRIILGEVESGSSTPKQRAEADAIEVELHEAERRVAEALTARLANGTVHDPERVRAVRDDLRVAANTTV
ncbi:MULTISPECIES: hypothetical protein [unclassified Haladaptatus]|uniref:hypothetical protein n=1 Tax=unclassified Haladaptatus TaxID=2622732 RepID=UPI0023E76696|nr:MULTISPECIES: hypothetical protein [unclassified Haladaptatus]